MNTRLIEDKEDWKDKIVKDYYAEHYPTPRVEKAIFKYLDQDYYTSEDNVFFTIYKKENDWFVNKSDIEDEIKNMFGLTLPDRIKVGPGEDDYIEPARNPVPKRVIQNWVNNHQGLKAHKEAMVHDKKKNSLKRRNDRNIEEDLENWGFDGKEIGPLKEQTNDKLTNKFIKDFWPQYRNQLYRELYNTYHPSSYVEGFNTPSSRFEDVLEIVGDAVNEGKKLGLLDSSVDWSDTYHYDFRGNSITKFNKEKEEWEDTKRVTDDNGLPTLNDQLEIMDRTNLDWIHGVLLFDVLEDIVDEFKSYCGENGVDESGMGKCMDEFPPSPNHEQINRTGGTLKQDYYTLYNFMKELERAGVNVKGYMKSPIFPNVIKLVDTGSSDYNEEGDWDAERDSPSSLEFHEQELTQDEKEDEIDRLETEIEIDKTSLKNMEKDLKDKAKKDIAVFGKTKRFGYEDDDDDKPAVIGIGRNSGLPSDQGGQVNEQEKSNKEPKLDFPDWKPEMGLSVKAKDLETDIKKTSIDLKKGEVVQKEKKLKDLKTKPTKTTGDSKPAMGDSTKPMGGDGNDSSVINIKSITDVDEQANPEDVDDYSDEEIDTQGGEIVRGDEDNDFNAYSDEEIDKRKSYDDDDQFDDNVSDKPFTRKEASILKQLHLNLTQAELVKMYEEVPGNYNETDKKFWNVMKLFGIEYRSEPEEDTRTTRYAKWAYDNWTKEGDYGSIQNPIKDKLAWYNIDREESGSQIEYKQGSAEVLGFDEEDAGERADYDFYSWGGEMETTDYGDYDSYDSEITNAEFVRLDERVDPSLKYNLNPEVESPVLNVPPIKIAQKFSDANGYGKIKFGMRGGNGIAYFTDKGLVVKLTADDSEYFTANKLVGDDNEYIVKVIESAKIKTSHSNHPIFVIVEEALPMTEEMEEKWSQCCCGVDSPIHIDYLEEPTLVLPPVSEHDKCLPIYDNIIGIQKNFAEYGIVWSDIGIDNMGIKNGKLVVIDLGETKGQGSLEGKIVTLEHIEIRPLTSKQIKKQLVLI